MKFSISRADFLPALRQAKSLAPSRTTLPILSSCLLQAKDGALSLRATDLEIEISLALTGDIQEPGAACLPAGKLCEIVDAMPEGCSLSLETLGGGWSRMKTFSGKSTFRLASQDPEDFPASTMAGGHLCRFSLQAGHVRDMIAKTVYACEEGGRILGGVLWSLSADKELLTLVGTDGHRLALVPHFLGEIAWSALPEGSEASPKDLELIIPAKALRHLVALIGREDAGELSIALQNNAAVFIAPTWSLSARALEGPFPEYAYVIPQRWDRTITIDRLALIQSVRRVGIIAKENRLNGVRLSAGVGEMVAESMTPEMGEASDVLSCELDREPISFGIAARYFMDALSVFSSPRVMLRLTDPNKAVLIEGAEGDPGIVVVMPLQMD